MNRVLALTRSELRLIFRNKTVLISTLAVPLGLGLFFALTGFGDGSGASIIAMQLAMVLGLGIYVAATQTLVARRQNLVLKRLRTSGISDAGLLTATIAPVVVLAVVQMVLFAVVDVAFGLPVPTSPLPVVLAAVGGLALVVTAALATAVVTPTAERAQITTLPLFFVMVGGAVVLAFLPLEGIATVVNLVPGAPLGSLANVAYGGSAFSPVQVASLVVWPVLFGLLAKRHFRWDARA
ncbi:ABC transporter permease [Pseudonocardia xishanensis]|uniref:ABC transporter permease n=1 Tax=Pseudonocardia xishanensis TaxID=630995 RepID=A0ABP8RKN7_9PSEU